MTEDLSDIQGEPWEVLFQLPEFFVNGISSQSADFPYNIVIIDDKVHLYLKDEK